MQLSTVATLAASFPLVCVLALPAVAQTTAQECLAAQQRAAGAACKGIARCYAKAMKEGTAVSATCIDIKQKRLIFFVEEVEAVANCLVKGEMRSVGDQLQLGLDEVGNDLTLTGGRCATIKMAGLGKACNGFFRCNAAADRESTTLDPACIAVHAARLADTFEKIEGKGSCATTGDVSTLQGKVANLVDTVHVTLRGTGTTTTSSTATTN